MAHFFSEGGFTVLQVFGYRFQIVDRKRNPILKQPVFPAIKRKSFVLESTLLNSIKYK